MKVFIGGSRRISRINDVIRQRLRNIIEQDGDVLVGDANGADKTVQTYFHEQNYSRVTVYYSGDTCRNNVGKWATHSIEVPPNHQGFKFYTAKDTAMSVNADYGFMLWDGQSSGTLNNILNLLKAGKRTLVYFSLTKTFFTVSSVKELNQILTQCSSQVISIFNEKIHLSRTLFEIESPKQMALPLERLGAIGK